MLRSFAPWRAPVRSYQLVERSFHPICSLTTQGMPAGTSSEKQAVRRKLKESLKQLTQDQMREESAAIARRVLSLPAFAGSKQVAVYVHCPRLREVDTSTLLDAALQQGSRVFVPRVLDRDAHMHFLHLDTPAALAPVPPFGIMEPSPCYRDGSPREDALQAAAPLQMVVMPGLGFTRRGHRLGRGGGYYDTFIQDCYQRAAEKGWEPPLLLALAYRAQLVGEVPVEAHDRPVDVLVTADEVIACSERGRGTCQGGRGGTMKQEWYSEGGEGKGVP